MGFVKWLQKWGPIVLFFALLARLGLLDESLDEQVPAQMGTVEITIWLAAGFLATQLALRMWHGKTRIIAGVASWITLLAVLRASMMPWDMNDVIKGAFLAFLAIGFFGPVSDIPWRPWRHRH